jgi:hypothetical protein
MLRRTSASGEDMQQDRSGGGVESRGTSPRNKAARAALAVVLAASFVAFDASLLRAADNDVTIDENAWNRMMTRLGLRKPPGSEAEIDYTERSPLVVPRTRELPPPGTLSSAPAADWPVDARKSRKRTVNKPGVVPDTAVQTANPQWQKKPWYNPMGWFSREEYASFQGEPVRQNLTDPPAGYRIPSPEQPYGISPEKKSGKKVAGDGTTVQTGKQGADQNPQAAPQQPAPQSAAPQPAAPPSQPGAPTVLAPQ